MRRTASILGTLALTASALAALPAHSAADENTYSVVGDLQTEISSCRDWDEKCVETEMKEGSKPGIYEYTAKLPAGSYEYKIVGFHGWDRAWGNGDKNMPITVKGPTEVTFQFDAKTKSVGVSIPTAGDYSSSDDDLVGKPAQRGTGENFYFVLTDRFSNGNPGNDDGGYGGDRLVNGFDPTDKGFYQGGDIAGLRGKLDYIQGLGTTAIWLTPSFKNRPVQGEGETASAGYHGYWVTDFTQLDPHLGTNEEFTAFVQEAHKRGIKVYFDIIVNHTADLIGYKGQPGGTGSYVAKADSPYKDAAGNVFDPSAIAGKQFPALDPASSFPYVPERRADVVPAELNDVTLYHNRGDSTWKGESVTYGDFVGLDDVMTENPKTVSIFEDVYKTWMDFGIDGFRIDTAKHVNFEFWQKWSETIHDHAKKTNPDFFTFGEVYDGPVTDRAPYARRTRMGATLDFGFQEVVKNYATGYGSGSLSQFFASDDYLTTTTSSAGDQPTFLGNHDMGRVAHMIDSAGAGDVEARSGFAHEVMFLTRGQPVVYYGDEQGFVGTGGDKDARQSMFPSRTPEYTGQKLADGTAFGTGEHFSTDASLYREISKVAKLRESTPALKTGAQIELYASQNAGIYAFSRVDRDEKVEYLVAVNNADAPQKASFTSLTPGAKYSSVHGGGKDFSAAADGKVSVEVPALGAVVYKADRKVAPSSGKVEVAPDAGQALVRKTTTLSGQDVQQSLVPVSANVTDSRWAETTFSYRIAGTDRWTRLGTATGDKPRVFHDVTGIPDGTLVEYRAVSVDAAGTKVADSGFGSVGVDQTIGKRSQPGPDTAAAVTVPGTHNPAMGCVSSWQPDCESAVLKPVKGTDWHSGTWDIPAGTYEYKVAVGGTWDVNFGAGGVPDGPNVKYTVDKAGPVTFYYNATTHQFFNTAQHPAYTIPGNFNKAVGCEKDWDPACLATLMTDPDGDGVFTYSTGRIPSGKGIEAKVSESLDWSKAFGRDGDGSPGAPNNKYPGIEKGKLAVFSYNPTTHILTMEVTEVPVAGEGQAIGFWLDKDTVAWPAREGSTYRLYYAAKGGMKREGEKVTGADGSVELKVKKGGLSPEQKALDPYLTAAYTPDRKDYAALTFGEDVDVEALLKGQIEVMEVGADGSPVAFSSLQTARVLDSLYATAARERPQGVTFADGVPSFSLWAPTAKSVTLRLYEDVASEKHAEHEMTRQSDGSWTLAGKREWVGKPYLYDVEVYVPATSVTPGEKGQEKIAGTVHHNLVTDPNSVGLTMDSKRSVVLDLTDERHMPKVWSDTPAPTIASFSERAILELHVRDFSATDASVPERLRGKYGAFGVEGSNGMRYLRELSAAGMNTVHLLPTYDLASVPENPAEQKTADVPAGAAADSKEQQAAVGKVADSDAFNWGYDPYHYTTPEGSYAVDPNGASRTSEYREMVGNLHGAGYQVVQDVVFNHTYAYGQDEKSVFEKVVPGYYHRLGYEGQTLTTPCCGEFATEHAMAEDHMIDSLLTWARAYRVDGFRFDLMEFHSVDSMKKVRAALDGLTLDKDGVDGKSMYLYGEGWPFGTTSNGSRFAPSLQGAMDGTGIGTFNDRLRDAVHGAQSDAKNDTQGFGNGLATDPNGVAGGDAAQLRSYTDTIRVGLAGNLKDYRFTAADGAVRRGAEISFNGQSVGYASQPHESVNYVDAHDNETLYDINMWKMPADSTMEERVRMNTLSLATATLGQSPVFWHAGTDLLRSKSMDRNSYNSGDWFNAIDWSGKKSNFGVGLPPARDNSSRWSAMAPYLANPANKPAAADISAAHEQALELLALRKSTPLFTLGDAAAIQEKVSFPNGGPNATPGLLVMRIDDTVGEDRDPALDGVLVVYNASPDPITEKIDGGAGKAYQLAPVQAQGKDAVVKTTAWDATSGTVTIPGRTVAVLTLPQQSGTPSYELYDAWEGAPSATLPAGSGEPLVGDWNGDGKTDTGIRVAGTNRFELDGQEPFHYGRGTDEVLVGDWDGDGKQTIAVRRGNEIYVNDAFRGGEASRRLSYGKGTDTMLVGDWDGDGKDTLGVRRGNQTFLKNTLTGGTADHEFRYGLDGDAVLVGNWDGKTSTPWDGDTLAVRRGNSYLLTNAATGGPASRTVRFGTETDLVAIGDWNGDGKDTPAIYRR